MALPSFISAGTDTHLPTSSAVANIPVPATQLDDLLLLVVMGSNANPNTVTAAGFTLIESVPANQYQSGLYLYYRWATASEPSTYPVSQSSGNNGRAKIYAYRGVSKANPVHVAAKSAAQNGTAAPAIPAITTTVAECLALAMSYEYNGRSPALSATGAQVGRGGSSVAGLCFLVTEEPANTAGALAGRTHNATASGDFYAISIALAPAAAGSGGASAQGSMVLAPAVLVGAASARPVAGGTMALASAVLSGSASISGAPATASGGMGLSAAVLAGAASSSAGSGGATIVGDAIADPDGVILRTFTIPKVLYVRLSDMQAVLSLTDQTTDADGMLPRSDAAFAPGATYLRVLSDSAGLNTGCKAYTASA